MSNLGVYFREINCKDINLCKTNRHHCKTCLRNKAVKYEDKFSLKNEGYSPLDKWTK